METPLVTPVALNAVGVAPLTTCWAKLAGDQAAKAVRKIAEKFVARMGTSSLLCSGITRQAHASVRHLPQGTRGVRLAARACRG
jgi:hypothetical protein